MKNESANNEITAAKLFSEIRNFLEKYFYFENDVISKVLSCYVMLTWINDRLDLIPYLHIRGTRGTGKSRLAEILSELCYMTTFSTGKIDERLIKAFENHATLIFEELDLYSKPSSRRNLQERDITKALQAGVRKEGFICRAKRILDPTTKVISFQEEIFSVYGPKILISTDPIKSDLALESRCIEIYLLPVDLSTVSKKGILLFSTENEKQDAKAIIEKLAIWRSQVGESPIALSYEIVDYRLSAKMNALLAPLFSLMEIISTQNLAEIVEKIFISNLKNEKPKSGSVWSKSEREKRIIAGEK